MHQLSNTSEILTMASILEATSKAELVSRFKTAIQSAGFETFVIGVERQSPNGELVHSVTSDYNINWQIHYQQNQYALSDPTVAHCQHSTTPLLWSESLFLQSRCMHMLEEASSYGISHGISLATHASNSKCMVSLVRDKPLHPNSHEQTHLMASARLLSACMGHLTHLLDDQTRTQPIKPLSAREKEVLQWIAQGKSSWEIAAIMRLSEATIAFHVKNLMKKLDVHSRQQALAIALRMGLIN